MSDFGLEITNRPDLPAVVARWQREITANELQFGYQAIRNTADGCGCWRWLLDLRRRNDMSTPEVTSWLTQQFLPQLAHRYEQPARLAFLVSPFRAEQVQVAGVPASPPDLIYESAVFTDEAAAFAWLAL